MKVGERVADRFVVEGPALAAGRTGRVLPARDLQTGRAVVLELLHEHLEDDRDARDRLRAAAGSAARLKHRHVLEVVGLFAHDGRTVLVSERVEGRSMAETVAAPLPAEAVLALGIQLADALDAAHRAGLVHGDVRPGNVLLGPRGAILFDFGLDALAREGRAVGHPGQTAPEVQEGAPPGVRSDLYGLGVVLFFALTAEPPYEGATPWATLGAQRRGAPPIPGPRGLARLVRRLLEPDATRRPPDAATVRRALRRLQRNPWRPVSAWREQIPPVRVRRAWVVHGTDPATGGPCLVASDLSRGRARALADRLQREGWQVVPAKDALGGRDLLLMAATAIALGVAFPIVGLVLGLLIGFLWRRATCNPALRDALSPVRAPIPPRRAAPGGEYAVAVGLLLLVAAVLVQLGTWLALLPLGLAAWITLLAWRTRRTDLAVAAAGARVQGLFAEIRDALDHRVHALDDQLSLQGELQVLEGEWRQGSEPDAVLLRAEALRERAFGGRALPTTPARHALEALRRGDGEGPAGAP